MAIQFRRGQFSKFDPSRLLPGEPAVVTSGDPSVSDGRALYQCFAAGDVKRMATYDDMDADVRNIFDDEFGPEVAEATAAATQAATTANSAANTASQAASTASTAANTAAAVAADAEERINAAIEAIGDISELAVPLMSADTRGGAKLGNGLAVTDGALAVGAIAKPTSGAVFGPLAQVGAKGFATQDGTPTPSAPVPVVCATGRNLISEIKYGKGITTAGAETDSQVSNCCGYIPVTAGATYVFSCETWDTTNRQVAWYDSTKEKVSNEAIGTSATAGKALTAPAGAAYVRIAWYNGASRPQLEAGSTARGYVPYGYAGLHAKGKNLSAYSYTGSNSGVTYSYDGTGACAMSGTSTQASAINLNSLISSGCAVKLAAGTYTVSIRGLNGVRAQAYDASTSTKLAETGTTASGGVADAQFTLAAAASVVVRALTPNATTVNGTAYIQLEAGSTPTKYVPYYDWTAPVPLPPAGFAASLPDGTADELTIDAAGHVVWVQRVGVYTIPSDATFATPTSLGTNYRSYVTVAHGGDAPAAVATGISDYSQKELFTHTVVASGYSTDSVHTYLGQTATGNSNLNIFAPISTDAGFLAAFAGATILYPLANPATHDLGYIDLPSVYGEGTASIPELAAFGCKSWVDEDGTIHALADAYHTRTLTEVAQATSDALASVAPVEGATASTNYSVGGYLVRDGKLCRVTSAIATGESITIGTNVTTTNVMAEVLSLTS